MITDLDSHLREGYFADQMHKLAAFRGVHADLYPEGGAPRGPVQDEVRAAARQW